MILVTGYVYHPNHNRDALDASNRGLGGQIDVVMA
jgi:hypothetical protein